MLQISVESMGRKKRITIRNVCAFPGNPRRSNKPLILLLSQMIFLVNLPTVWSKHIARKTSIFFPGTILFISIYIHRNYFIFTICSFITFNSKLVFTILRFTRQALWLLNYSLMNDIYWGEYTDWTNPLLWLSKQDDMT